MRRHRKTSLLDFVAEMIIMLFQALWWLIKTIFPILIKAVIWILWIVLPGAIFFVWSIWGYSKSEYKQITGKSLLDVYFDKGSRGEYLIYRYLRGQHKDARWIFNAYIPRDDGRTTEIDALMIDTSGVYVFESKNYSGWIFGSFDRDKWTQCIKSDENSKAKKFHFLNPMIQNDIHVKHLKPLLPENVQKFIFPVVVFGNNCQLKKIDLAQSSQPVINRFKIKALFKKRIQKHVIEKQMIQDIYESLYVYTQVDETVKSKHIADIERIKQ